MTPLVDDGGHNVVHPVQPHVDREHEADNDLIEENNNGLDEMERVPREGCGSL